MLEPSDPSVPPSGESDRPAPAESILLQRIEATGPVSFAEFMETALYHPESGYYRSRRTRVGARPDADFFTAYAAGNVFGDLVTAAAVQLLGDEPPETHTLVEIGIEPGRSLWREPPEPFRALRPLAYGEAVDIPGRAVVFSNELFDAQPFHRVRFVDGKWREAGVGCEDGKLAETLLPETTAPVTACAHLLPGAAVDGQTIDLPIGSVTLLDTLLGRPWSGMFIAFDYGRRWEELCREFPEGTLRAYSRHRQNPSILDHPGEQDLTGHICWDWMEECLVRHGFHDLRLESQEAFFIRHAAPVIERISRANPGLPDRDRSRLHQLLHPSHMGQKFQVLSARRP